MKSAIYWKIKALIFLLSLDFLHCYEYYEEGPSSLLLFIKKDGINKRISDRGIVIAPKDHSKTIPDGTMVLSYNELVKMHESGHIQSEMIGLYYFDVDKHYIGSGKNSVKGIITWGRKTTNQRRDSAKIVLTPISNSPNDFLLFAFRDIRRTLSYDFSTISNLGKTGRLKGNSAALLVMFDEDWYSQGPIASLAETYLKMDASDKQHSKFYLISDILGTSPKHFAEVTISTGDIPDFHNKLGLTDQHENPATQHKSTISQSNIVETYEEDFDPLEGSEDPYFNQQQIPFPIDQGMIPSPADIPWLGGQLDMSYLTMQAPNIMVPVNIEDLIAGSLGAPGPLFTQQVPMMPIIPHEMQKRKRMRRVNPSPRRSFQLTSPDLNMEIATPVKPTESKEPHYVSLKGIVAPVLRSSKTKDLQLMPWWDVKSNEDKNVNIKKKSKPIRSGKPSNFNGLAILFPKRTPSIEGVIVVPREKSIKINVKETKLLSITDIFSMSAKNQLLNSDVFLYFLPNENFTKISIGNGNVSRILNFKDKYFVDNWNHTKAFQINSTLYNQTMDIYNFQIYNDTKSYSLKEIESNSKLNESVLAVFESWFTQESVEDLIKWYHANKIAVPFVKVYYLKDLLARKTPIDTIKVNRNNSNEVEVLLQRDKHVYIKKTSDKNSYLKKIFSFVRAMRSIKQILKKSGILILSPEPRLKDGVVFIPKTKVGGDIYFYPLGFEKPPRHITLGQLDKMWENVEVDDSEIILFIDSNHQAKLTTVGKLIPSIRSGNISKGEVFMIVKPDNATETFKKISFNSTTPAFKMKDIERLLNEKIVLGFDRVLFKNEKSFILSTVHNLLDQYKKGKPEIIDIYILKNKAILRKIAP